MLIPKAGAMDLQNNLLARSGEAGEAQGPPGVPGPEPPASSAVSRRAGPARKRQGAQDRAVRPGNVSLGPQDAAKRDPKTDGRTGRRGVPETGGAAGREPPDDAGEVMWGRTGWSVLEVRQMPRQSRAWKCMRLGSPCGNLGQRGQREVPRGTRWPMKNSGRPARTRAQSRSNGQLGR